MASFLPELAEAGQRGRVECVRLGLWIFGRSDLFRIGTAFVAAGRRVCNPAGFLDDCGVYLCRVFTDGFFFCGSGLCLKCMFRWSLTGKQFGARFKPTPT